MAEYRVAFLRRFFLPKRVTEAVNPLSPFFRPEPAIQEVKCVDTVDLVIPIKIDSRNVVDVYEFNVPCRCHGRRGAESAGCELERPTSQPIRKVPARLFGANPEE